MALATQCPHCFTIFRVASDQLKLRGGLVRCGACREVFNGGEYLVEASIADGQYHAVPGSKAQIALPENRPQASPAFSPTAPIAPPPAPASRSPIAAPPLSQPLAPTSPYADEMPPANTPDTATPSQTSPIPAIQEPKVFRSPGHPDYIPDLSSPLKAGSAVFASNENAQPHLLRTRALDENQPAAGLSIQSQQAGSLSPLPLTPSNATSPDIAASIAAPDITSPAEESPPLLRTRSTDATPPSNQGSIGAPAPNWPIDDAQTSLRQEPSLNAGSENITTSEREIDIADATPDSRTTDATNPATATDEPDTEAEASPVDAFDDDDEPAFVKKAEQRERIGGVLRMTMVLLAAIMTPIILLQGMYYWRNQLAATVPVIRPMLNGMCATFHCTVGLPAEIDQLSLESNELQVVPPSQNIYTLSVVIRNRSSEAQAWPHIELTLNNDDEKPVVRRVFRPLDFLASQQVIDGGLAGSGEQQIKLTFELKDALVSGYRIYLFYP